MIRSSMSSIPAGEWKRIFKRPKLTMTMFYREIKKAAKEFGFNPPINPPPKGWQDAVYVRVQILKKGKPRSIRVAMKKELK